MKYLPLLLLLLCLACQDRSANQQTGQAGDSVLRSPLVLPLTDSIRQFPDNATLYFRRGMLLFNTDPGLAQADFEKAAELEPKATDHWAGAGEAALVTEKYEKAAAYFEKALQTVPGNAYLQYRLATAWIERGHLERADSLAAVMGKKPDAVAQSFYLRARIAEDRKDTLQAIEHLKSAVTAAGKESEYNAVLELADLLHSRHAADAPKYYELAMELDPTNADPLFELARYYEELGRAREATATYKRCVETDPGYAPAYIALGKQETAKQQWKAALSYFNLAARARPNEAEAYYYRGLCYERLGNSGAAADDYRKALSFRRNYPEAQKALEKVSNSR
jgi:tetratricopeptide (TPR) repeat protein